MSGYRDEDSGVWIEKPGPRARRPTARVPDGGQATHQEPSTPGDASGGTRVSDSPGVGSPATHPYPQGYPDHLTADAHDWEPPLADGFPDTGGPDVD